MVGSFRGRRYLAIRQIGALVYDPHSAGRFSLHSIHYRCFQRAFKKVANMSSLALNAGVFVILAMLFFFFFFFFHLGFVVANPLCICI
jgi:ABC-type multidrug transport system permease subunit